MFTSKVRELMDKKSKTIRDISTATDLSVSTVHRATQDATIGGCQLNTLAKIGGALGVKAKRLFDEVEGEANAGATNMSFEWSTELATGDAHIDTQHKQLFATANALFSAYPIGKERQKIEETLKSIVQYIIEHFADEEAFQKKHGYPEYPAHKQDHDNFSEQVEELLAKFPQDGSMDDFISEVYITIGEWLLNHVRGEDLKMIEYIRGKAQKA